MRLMSFYRCFVLTGPLLLAAPFQLTSPNREFESLQAHFDRVISARSDALFAGIRTVAQWEERKQQTRLALTRMLWHDRRWPDRPPPATITRREEYPQYIV